MARVLLVDDVHLTEELERTYLKRTGCRVETAATAREVLEAAQARSPDVVLLEVGLPDMTGPDLCRALKADPRTAGIPVLFVTSAHDASRCLEAGADGFLVVDLPIEEAGEMRSTARKAGMDWVPLASPTSGPDRVRTAAATGSGFLYLISVTGITGIRRSLPPGLAAWTRRVKGMVSLPVAVGFGISTPAMARAASADADAAVVGSACVRLVERHGTSRKGPDALRRFVQSLKNAMR